MGLLARSLSSSRGPRHMAAWAASWYGSWVPRRRITKKETSSCQANSGACPEKDRVSLVPYFIQSSPRLSSESMWQGASEGMNNKRDGLLRHLQSTTYHIKIVKILAKHSIWKKVFFHFFPRWGYWPRIMRRRYWPSVPPSGTWGVLTKNNEKGDGGTDGGTAQE